MVDYEDGAMFEAPELRQMNAAFRAPIALGSRTQPDDTVIARADRVVVP